MMTFEHATTSTGGGFSRPTKNALSRLFYSREPLQSWREAKESGGIGLFQVLRDERKLWFSRRSRCLGSPLAFPTARRLGRFHGLPYRSGRKRILPLARCGRLAKLEPSQKDSRSMRADPQRAPLVTHERGGNLAIVHQ